VVQLLFFLFVAFASFFLGTYLGYFTYVWRWARRPWNLKIEKSFQPKITVLVPAHNEESNIELKLKNIKDALYPKEKIEVIVVDDASEDNTLEKARLFIENNPDLRLTIVRQYPRVGKSAALNKALDLSANEIVVVSDADTLWPPNILVEVLPYLADPTVGAVTGRSVNRNIFESWVTRGEDIYLNLMSLIRVGESKIHSTIRFEGGFCAYKREAFKRFDCETGSDDSGTALEVVQNGFRAIMVPEAVFYTDFPTKVRDKFKIKVRRANQLFGLWFKCLKLILRGEPCLPKRIAVPEIILFIINPIIFVALIATVLIMLILSPLSPFSIAIIFSTIALLVFARHVFIELLLDNLILFYALITFLLGRRFVAWEKPG
jgi:cellulose synthase/poly-beta-1,6-N-acetylglucosamine synthase-like glycosyltransferase